MTKVYVLSSGDEMDDYELHGIFSRYWKAYKASIILSAIEDKELHIGEYELDELEQIYAEVQSGVYRYHLSSPKYSSIPFSGRIHWNVYKTGIDSYLFNRFEDVIGKEYAIETDNFYSASVRASSDEEAIEKAENLLAESKK